MKINKVITVSEFVTAIDKIVQNTGVEYMDACISYAESKSIEIETVASLVKQSAVLKQKIQAEGENVNMLKRTTQRIKLHP
jgi:hypothetical protein